MSGTAMPEGYCGTKWVPEGVTRSHTWLGCSRACKGLRSVAGSGMKWEPVCLQRKSKAQQCPKGIAERSGSP
ncbi:MAG: hypothetical protein QF682_08215 [Candidatus Thermoplasmatota archaeon]|nr:hypothetical protein [Candidatus Thermoplasmatota archaeon]